MKKNTETAFVIGTGPSLNKINISKLKNYDCVTFNRAYIAFNDWGFVPRYYLAIDGNDIRSIYKDINSLVKKHKSTDFFLLDDKDGNEIHPKESFQDCEKKDLLFDFNQPNLHNLKNICDSIEPNAGFMGVELLKTLGYKNIGFVGCDCKYFDDDKLG